MAGGRIVLTLGLAVALASCLPAPVAQAKAPPRPAESEWLATETATFSIAADPRGLEGAVRYEMLFRVRKPVSEKLFMTVDFENPRDGSTPLVAGIEVAPGATGFAARSEFIHAIRNRHKYRVTVRIYADAARTRLLGTHEQLVLFEMPPELFDRFGIELIK